MKRKLYTLCLTGILSVGAVSGQSIFFTSPRQQIIEDIYQFSKQKNYIGVMQYNNLLPNVIEPLEQNEKIAYLNTLSKLHTQQEAPLEIVNEFLERYPTTYNRQNALLLLGHLYLDKGDYDRAEYIFKQIKPEGLSQLEKTQWQVQWAYSIIKHFKVAPGKTSPSNENLKQARNLLLSATTGVGPWDVRALLYLVALDIAEGDIGRASNVLSNTSWPEDLKPEAELYQVLILMANGKYREGVNKGEQLKQRYPEMRDRTALLSALGQAYFQLNDNRNTISNLSALFNNSNYALNAAEGFDLGVAYYLTGNYQEAIRAIGVATDGSDKTAAVANLYKGSAFGKLGQVTSAITSLEAVVTSKQAPKELRELALYNMAVILRQNGISNFGQAVKTAERFINEFEDSRWRPTMANMLTESYFTSKDYETSLSSIKRIKNPTASIINAKQYILCNLANQAGERGNISSQSSYLNEAIAAGNHGPYYGLALLERAKLLLSAQNFNDAEKDASTYLRQQFDDIQNKTLVYYLLGYARYNQGKYPEAYNAYNEALSLRDNDKKLTADILCRMADCKYVTRNLSEALELYNKANNIPPTGLPEAMVKMAEIYNLQKDYTRQISTINKLLANHPTSLYAAEALYQKGRAAVVGKLSTNEAISAFTTVQQKYPDSKWARLASVDLALLYYNNGKVNQAIETYKNMIRKYKYSDEARAALSDLKSICLEQDRIQEYTDFIASLGAGFSPSKSEAAHLNFLAAETKYRSNQPSAKQVLTDYLSTYPHSTDSPKAMLYLASIYEKEGNNAEALSLYRNLTEQEISSEIRIKALSKIGLLSYNEQNYNQAYDAYKSMVKIAIDKEEKAEALLGQAKTGLKLNANAEVVKILNDFFELNDINATDNNEALLYRGTAYMNLGNLKNAETDFAKIIGNNDSPIGAEATVRLATIKYQGKQYKASKKLVEEFIKKGSSQQYWLARAFVLLSDIYTSEGDLYTAKQYLQSLQENFGGKNSEIDEMINDRLSKLNKKIK